MFLNKARFKKLVKSAFNTCGLTVGQIYGGLVISGNIWTTWTEEGYVPNWVKAAVMEYTGELPKQGCVFKAKKDAPIQYEIAKNLYYDLPSRFLEARHPFVVTPIVYDESWNQYRFLQNKSTKELIAVDTNLYDVLDMAELGDENRPTGPSSASLSGDSLIWKNEHSALAIYKLNISGDSLDVMNLLKTYSFEEEWV